MMSLLAELTVRSRCPTTTSVMRIARALSMYGSREEPCSTAAGWAVSVVIRDFFRGLFVGCRLHGAGAPAGRSATTPGRGVVVTPAGRRLERYDAAIVMIAIIRVPRSIPVNGDDHYRHRTVSGARHSSL